MDKQGIKGLPPLSPAPQIPASGSSTPLRTSHARHRPLTMANTSGTIIPPASLRSHCCSPSSRNTVRFPPGSVFAFTGIRRKPRCQEKSSAEVNMDPKWRAILDSRQICRAISHYGCSILNISLEIEHLRRDGVGFLQYNRENMSLHSLDILLGNAIADPISELPCDIFEKIEQ